MYTHIASEQDRVKRRAAANPAEKASMSPGVHPPAMQLKVDGLIQREAAMEEEELQAKFAPIQREEAMEEEELQAKFAPIQREAAMEEEELQAKFTPVQREEAMEEEELQAKFAPVQRSSHSQAYQLKMDPDTQQHMEQTFQADFSGVNVHANSDKASDVGALAYTQGNDVHFAPGQYQPGSSSGRELIGHELTHVVQQREGRVQATGSVKGMPLNDDVGLEREADEMGRKAGR